jgi:hypothetical protein
VSMTIACGTGSNISIAVDPRKVDRVMRDTWGHLAPKAQTYSGWMVFARSAYPGDGVTLLNAEFEDLNDSPWLYAEMQEWIARHVPREACVYRFDGTYTRFETGAYRFAGKVRSVSAGRVMRERSRNESRS